MIWLLVYLIPPTPFLPSVSSTGDTQEERERKTSYCGEKGGKGLGEDRWKAWSSVNDSIISGLLHETKTKKGRGGVAGGQEDGKMGDEG
jgi:hypothetical protein